MLFPPNTVFLITLFVIVLFYFRWISYVSGQPARSPLSISLWIRSTSCAYIGLPASNSQAISIILSCFLLSVSCCLFLLFVPTVCSYCLFLLFVAHRFCRCALTHCMNLLYYLFNTIIRYLFLSVKRILCLSGKIVGITLVTTW